MPFLVTNLQFLKMAASVKSAVVCNGLDFVLGTEIQSKYMYIYSPEFHRRESILGLKQFIHKLPSFLVSFSVWMGV